VTTCVKTLKKIEPNPNKRKEVLNWLYKKGYLNLATFKNAWNYPLDRYVLNWEKLEEKLGVTHPPPLKPISPELFKIGKLT